MSHASQAPGADEHDRVTNRLTQSARADALRALHHGSRPLVLGNAWDAASARVLAKAGFSAVATTSGGVAEALGYGDHEQAPADAMFAAAGRIALAVELPVTADLEAGYGLTPEDLARRAVEAGVAGLNLEDSDYRAGGLVDSAQQAARIAGVKAAARRLGVDLVLNARIDVFVRRAGAPESWLSEATRRGLAYRDAGADCVYPILLDDAAAIAEFVAAVGARPKLAAAPARPEELALEHRVISSRPGHVPVFGQTVTATDAMWTSSSSTPSRDRRTPTVHYLAIFMIEPPL